MSNIIVWDKNSDLKGISKDIWIKGYPQAISKTLALIDDVEVVFVEDLKAKGYTGATDIEVVQSYIDNPNIQTQQLIDKKVEKAKVENALGIAEIVEKVEKDKVELASAVTELVEFVAPVIESTTGTV